MSELNNAVAGYYELRGLSPGDYEDFQIPAWLRGELTDVPREARLLDLGCGFGYLLNALQRSGFTHLEGADIDRVALERCRAQGLRVRDMATDAAFFGHAEPRYDVIIALHVLEHIPKNDIIGVLAKLRRLLNKGGKLILAVPNAQAFTGAYWAYEDFTHHTLFTSGSAFYVLRSAGFDDIRFIDVDCSAGLPILKAIIRKLVLKLYAAYYTIMCSLLASHTHRPSPNIFSYELKVVARDHEPPRPRAPR